MEWWQYDPSYRKMKLWSVCQRSEFVSFHRFLPLLKYRLCLLTFSFLGRNASSHLLQCHAHFLNVFNRIWPEFRCTNRHGPAFAVSTCRVTRICEIHQLIASWHPSVYAWSFVLHTYSINLVICNSSILFKHEPHMVFSWSDCRLPPLNLFLKEPRLRSN